MGFMASKRILITGMISTRSIAYGIAQAMHREGAELDRDAAQPGHRPSPSSAPIPAGSLLPVR